MKSEFGLSEKTIASIQDVFSAFSNVEEVLVYGSRAKVNFRKNSELLAIESALDDLLLPYKIDLSIYTQIESKELLEHIRLFSKCFYRLTK